MNLKSNLLRISSIFFFIGLTVLLGLAQQAHGQTIINITSGGDAGPTSGTNWSISGTTLTATGTANIQASVIETALSSGNLTVVSGTGSDFIITVNEAIDYTGATERTLTFGATHRLLVYQNISSTSAPLNIILASEIDRASGFTGGGFGVGVFSTITTNGGDIWIGGGQLTGSWNGHTVGVGAAMGNGGANGVGVEISNATIGTNGGDVRILGTSNGLPGINAYHGNSTIDAGAGNIELISDRMGFDFGGSQGDIQIDGTGYLALAPLESSFANAVTWDGTLSSGYYTSTGGANTIDGLKIKNTMGLIIGKPDNSAPLTIASDIVINGPISFESGSFIINSSVDLQSTAAGADIVVKVNDYTPGPNATDGYITFQGDNITTNGGNIILWANASNRSSGTANNEIWLQGSSTLTSNGGKIVLAGGLDDGGASSGLAGLTAGDGIPDGFAYRGDLNSSAVIINDNVTLLSGGGDVIIRGQSGGTPPNAFPRSFGVWADAGFKLDSGSGTINIRGKSESESAIWLGTTESAGALSPIAITSASTAANAITIHGESTTNRHGLIANWDGSTGSHVLIESSGASGGGVSITGITNGANDGLILGQTATNESIQILSQAGDVSLISNAGLYIGNDAFLGNRKDGNAVNGITPSVQSSSADILIRANSFNVGSAIDVSATGELTIEPYGNVFSSAYSTSGLTLGSALTGLTIGKSTNTANVTIASATEITGPITVYGGDIAVNENLNTTAGGALGDVLLKATGNTSQAASKSITTSGGDVTLWADSDDSGAGYIQLTGGSNSGITSGGGNIFLGGGTDLATGYARGAAVTDNDPNLMYYIAGVHLRSDTEINSGGGNITLRGQNVGNSVGDNIVQPGIMGISTTLNAGTGKIALYGLAGGSGSANAQAISNSGSGWTIRSASTEADAITLIGDATSTDNSATSLGINFSGIIEATGNGGGIVLTGTSGTTTGYGDGLDIVGDVLAASGTITITGTDDATNTSNRDVFLNNATLGFKTATNVTSSTANVLVRGNRPAFGSNVAVNTSGTFTLEPAGDDFTSDITYPITPLTLDAAVSGLTIGKASSADGTSDVNVTIDGATSIAGPITVYGGDIAVNAALTATNDDINLHASGAVTQSAALTAGGLGLYGSGTFTLTHASNAADTLAGGSGDAPLGLLSYVDSDSLVIGAVNPTGVVSSGAVSVRTLSGDLVVTEPVVSTLATGDAVVLAADSDASSGTEGDGQLRLTGNGSVTVEAGARGLLYSGKESLSTGVQTAVGGEDNIRFFVDTTTDLTTVDPAVGATGVYGLFRMLEFNPTDLTPSITNPADSSYVNTSNVTTFAINGTVLGADSVRITLTPDTGVAEELLVEVAADSFSVEHDMSGFADGVPLWLTAVGITADGSESVADSVRLFKDTVVPTLALADTLLVVSDTTPSLSGTSNETTGTTVTITFTDQSDPTQVFTYTGSVTDDDGNWLVTVGEALADGTYDVTVVVTDAAGNASVAGQAVYTIDSTATGKVLLRFAASPHESSNPDSVYVPVAGQGVVPSSLSGGYGSALQSGDWSYEGHAVDFAVIPSTGITQGMQAAALTIYYDATVLDLTGVTEGTFFTNTENGGSFFMQELADSTGSDGSVTGRVRVDVANLGGNVALYANTDSLFTLNFVLSGAGYGDVKVHAYELSVYDEYNQAGINADLSLTLQAESNTGEVLFYPGDTSSPGASGVPDTKVDFSDLTGFAAAYFTSSGDAGYRLKYDIGSSGVTSYFALPVSDGQISFRDLVTFATGYTLSLSRTANQQAQPTMNKTSSAEERDPLAVKLGVPQEIIGGVVGTGHTTTTGTGTTAGASTGTDGASTGTGSTSNTGHSTGTALYRYPVLVDGVAEDLRAVHLALDLPAGLTLQSVERAGAFAGEGGFAAHMRNDSLTVIDLATVGEAMPVHEQATLLYLTIAGGDGAILALRRAEVRDSYGREVSARVLSLEETLAELPQEFSLGQNYPNPFNPATTIRYELPQRADVRLEVYDILGRRVALLVDDTQTMGRYEVRFDASRFASGTYLYRLIAGDYVEVRKMMLIK